MVHFTIKRCRWIRGLGEQSIIIIIIIILTISSPSFSCRWLSGHSCHLLWQLQWGRQCSHWPGSGEKEPRGKPSKAEEVVPRLQGGFQDQLRHQSLQCGWRHERTHQGPEPCPLEGKSTLPLAWLSSTKHTREASLGDTEVRDPGDSGTF